VISYGGLDARFSLRPGALAAFKSRRRSRESMGMATPADRGAMNPCRRGKHNGREVWGEAVAQPGHSKKRKLMKDELFEE